MRSRVIPGSSPTIDRRDPVSRLNNVLFPTFGRPHTPISGRSRASTLAVSVPICEASNSTSRQSSKSPPICSRPSIFDDRGVCRPTIPSAGLTCFTLEALGGVPFGVFAAGASPRIALRFSLSGDCFVNSAALSAAARLVESTFRFLGSTAPVVGVDFGARPFLGRVLACRCFLPNRFLSSLWATEIQLSPAHASSGQALRYLFAILSIIEIARHTCRNYAHKPHIVHHRSHLDPTHPPGESPEPPRLLRPRRHPLEILSRLRAPPRPVRHGPSHRVRLQGKTSPHRRSRHRHRKNPRLPLTRYPHGPRAQPAHHYLHRHKKSPRAALLQRCAVFRIPTRPAKSLLHEGPRQLSLPPQALRPSRQPNPPRPR